MAEDLDDTYAIKRVEFLGRRNVPVLMQTKNGPCPLLAIANALFLWDKIHLDANQELISLKSLVEMLAGALFDLNANAESPNTQQLLDDCIGMLPTLARGLDVNVQFSGVRKFEFDRNVGVFDVFGLELFHGWVVDEGGGEEVFSPMRQESYNTLIVKASLGEDLAKLFLESTSSQLTYAGLTELHAQTSEGQLGVFFRNNHFSTLFKHEGSLYLLCTDHSLLARAGVMWERLSDINGDTELVSPTFGHINDYCAVDAVNTNSSATYQELASFYQVYCPERNTPEQINQMLEHDRDVLNALLRSEHDGRDLGDLGGGGGGDEALARQLQMEENNRRRSARPAKPASPPPSSCVIA